jgi:hypothetical protein
MNDPLAGYRKQINERRITTLIWPADQPCPVEKGQMYELQSCTIEIEQPSRKLIKGRQAEWHVKFVRHEVDRPQLLRYIPPTRAPTGDDGNLNLTDTERARRESAYTSTSHAASPHEPESVGPDWEDKRRGERELERQAARKSMERQDAEIDKAAARLKQVGKTLGANGHDLTHLLEDVYERLATEERDAA